MLKTIRIYAEFYDGAMTSAWILHAAEMSAASSVKSKEFFSAISARKIYQIDEELVVIVR
jgi:hypothetical protein